MVELSWFENYGINDYKGYNMSSLRMDEAYLSISLDSSINKCKIFTKHIECMKCPYVKMEDGTLFLEDGMKIILKGVPYYDYRITTEDVQQLKVSDKFLCKFGKDFGEFGIYHAHISTNSCLITTVKKAVSTVFPVLTVFFIYCGLVLCVFGSVYLWRKIIKRKTDQRDVKMRSTTTRILSLDIFRGITITIMIFVHYGGGGYEVLHLSHWNGLHVADLAFPWFMWIMGACIPISLQSRFKKQIPKGKICLNILKRSMKLFCLGLFIGSGFSLECLRIFDVLQRIAISYLVVATSCLFFMKRKVPRYEHRIWNHFNDVLLLYKNWIMTLIILFVHCMLIFLVAEDGCPKGYLGPGGLHDNGRYFNCTGGSTGYIDRIMLLGKHMPKFSVTRIYHSTQQFDPEGILGCLTSIVQVFIGTQAGIILLVYQSHQRRVKRWLIWGILTGIIGGALCGFSKNDGLIPINKKLWSTSYVFVTSSFAFFLLSFFYFFNDVKKWWFGKPFLFAGMNSIALYIGHTLFLRRFPLAWTVFCDEHFSTHLVTLFGNIWSVCVWLLIAYFMYSKNCFIIL